MIAPQREPDDQGQWIILGVIYNDKWRLLVGGVNPVIKQSLAKLIR